MVTIVNKLGRFNVALINNEITLQAFDLLQRYRLSHGMALPDSFIAATAMVTEMKLFTYNIKDFKFISSLKFFKS